MSTEVWLLGLPAVSRAFTPVVAKAADSKKASTQARHARLRKKVRLSLD